MRQRKRWQDLTATQRLSIVLLGALQVALLAAAQIDIQRRAASQIRGRKAWWRALAFVNLAGPLAYFAWGRIRQPRPLSEEWRV